MMHWASVHFATSTAQPLTIHEKRGNNCPSSEFVLSIEIVIEQNRSVAVLLLSYAKTSLTHSQTNNPCRLSVQYQCATKH